MNRNSGSPARIVCLAGPTGTGKNDLALRLADRHQGAIINFDSRQVYRALPIVTAQPSPEEQSRCPHLLYGFLNSDRTIDAGSFAALAAQAIADVRSQGYLPLLVGGTGLYLRALLEGLAPVPRIEQEVRERMAEQWNSAGDGVLHARLLEVDPEYAARIHPRDRQRVTRALEVFEQTGRPLTEWHKERVSFGRYDPLKIGVEISLEDLTPRLSERIERMIDAGALEEVSRAYERFPDPNALIWSGIGCREILGYLRGESTLEEAKEQWLRSTRAYAKRQLTWFKAERGMHWFRPEEVGKVEIAVERWRRTRGDSA
jgi:tRNA dimethylallyltransferase